MKQLRLLAALLALVTVLGTPSWALACPS